MRDSFDFEDFIKLIESIFIFETNPDVYLGQTKYYFLSKDLEEELLYSFNYFVNLKENKIDSKLFMKLIQIITSNWYL